MSSRRSRAFRFAEQLRVLFTETTATNIVTKTSAVVVGGGAVSNTINSNTVVSNAATFHTITTTGNVNVGGLLTEGGARVASNTYVQRFLTVANASIYLEVANVASSLLSGPAGSKGQKGEPGTNGTNGADGSNGADGAKGQKGEAGTNGTNGTNGAKGQKGEAGTNGTNGADGSNGADGAKGQKGESGTNGTNGADGAKGAAGSNGTNGADGAKGQKGEAGTNGTNGTNGAKGQKGEAGTNGTNGTNGADGAKGQKGEAGTNGTNGSNGAKGQKGEPGANGTNGTNGSNGAKGQKGEPGAAGTNGTNGSNGAKGQKGEPGAVGPTGPAGSTSYTAGAVSIQGYGSSTFTYNQTSSSFAGYTGGWASYLISNHGNGSNYYNQTIIMPFWGPPQYSRLENGTAKGPYTFITTENLNSVWHAGNDGSGSGLDADLVDGYHVSTTRNAANSIPVRDGNGYLQLGWINTTSGVASGTTALDRIYCSYDGYIRYSAATNFLHRGNTLLYYRAYTWIEWRDTGVGLYWSNSTGAGWHIYPQDTAYMRFRSGSSSSGGIRFNTNGTDRNYLYHDSANQIGFLTTAGGWALKVDNSGNVTATANVTAYSDIRLKANIQPIENALDKVCKLQGVEYTRKSSGEREIGFIAQDVKKIIPELVDIVNTQTEASEDGYEDLHVMKYQNSTALLVEAIKELKSEINVLRAEIIEMKKGE